MAFLRCSCCGKEMPAKLVFVYEDDDNYCFRCCSELIYTMALEGYLTIECEDKENRGVRLEW